MKIRFLQDTYIRQAPRIGGKPPIGVVHKGTEMEVLEDFIPGDEISRKSAGIIGWAIVIFVLAVFATAMEVVWAIKF